MGTVWARCALFGVLQLLDVILSQQKPYVNVRRQISDFTRVCFSLDVIMCVRETCKVTENASLG